MCDTVGVTGPAGALFAKNSDRSANEPQVLEWYPPSTATGTVRTTYLTIPRPPQPQGFLLSRPAWLWGGEMGVNTAGVCIGNEAVFTRGPYAKTGLLGMDMLRIALGCARTAAEGVDVLIGLLEEYGQGGDGGYDHPFFYDNSFLVMDRDAVYVLETAGRAWVVRRSRAAAISNRLAIGTDGDRYSGGTVADFARTYRDPVYSYFSGSARRLASTSTCLTGTADVRGLFAVLRRHTHSAPPLTRASVASPCMHAGGLVGDQTTASLVVEVGATTPPADPAATTQPVEQAPHRGAVSKPASPILVWATGTSAPCIGLFKPYALGGTADGLVYDPGDPAGLESWLAREAFHRAAIGRVLPEDFYAERDSLESEWVAATRAGWPGPEFAAETVRAETGFYARWSARLGGRTVGSPYFRRYWRHRTALLATPAKPFLTASALL